jgi:23S rRNA pseudouridine1911/1915/1917 synthase
MTSESPSFTIDAEHAGGRLDSFLASVIEAVSRTRLQRAIEDGDILVNERLSKPSHRLRAGDRIDVELPEPPPVELQPESIPLNIAHEDEDLIVLDKPAGMVVHPGSGISSGTLANALVHHFNQLSGRAGLIRPGIVHRIDKDTSGLLIVAKNDFTHERLSDQFRDRKVFKLYFALVYGRSKHERGEIDSNIGRDPRHRTRMAVLRGGAGRPALTIYEVDRRLQSGSDEFTLLRVQIKTGRTHQIRVHLTSLGYPVVGDSIYGAGRDKSVSSSAIRGAIRSMNRQFLHATRLELTHPRTGELLKLESPLPAELEVFLSKIA